MCGIENVPFSVNSCLYEWSTMLSSDSLLKKSLDYVLCAACHIQPEFFTMILEWMGIIINFDHSMNASISDDCKDSFQFHQGTMTDDSKEASHVPPRPPNSPPITLQELSHMMLDESRLATLALVCKSPVAIKQLLDSGFPAVLAQCLYEFCKSEFVRMSENNDTGSSRSGTNVVSEGITVIKEETPDLAETGEVDFIVNKRQIKPVELKLIDICIQLYICMYIISCIKVGGHECYKQY